MIKRVVQLAMSGQGEKGGSFWDRYIEYITGCGIRENVRRWYVVRIEQYLKTLPDIKITDHTPEDVNNYLDKLGRSVWIEDWQFLQVVDAIQKMYQLEQVPWLGDVDWNQWRISSQSLAENHQTIAPDAPAEETVDRLINKETSFLAEGRKNNKELLKDLLVEIRTRGYSIRTEQAYEGWVARFIAYVGNRNLQEVENAEIVSFLQHLAVERNVSASTQNQALNALVFCYEQVLKTKLGDLGQFVRAKRPRKLPVVLSPGEVARLLENMEGVTFLMATLLYGAGLRLMECVRLRVQDIDFEYLQIIIRDGKGKKDRVVPLPGRLIEPLKKHLGHVRDLFQKDLDEGLGAVYLPQALARKYPNAEREWKWQYVFPSSRLSVDPRSRMTRRHHLHENGLQKAVKKASENAGIEKKVNCHCLRHSFATHLLQHGYDIRTVQELLGHADVSTTMVYTHVLNRGGKGVFSPLDSLKVSSSALQ